MPRSTRNAPAEGLPRAAIYARYSTEHQNEKSTEDQIDLCRAFAKSAGYEVIATYKDAAKSGASLFGRDEVNAMIRDALTGRFDVIIVEAFDRLSRDNADLAGVFKQLEFAGVRLVGVNDGEANTVSIGLRGLVNQMYREDNVHKVRRGMSGLVKHGLTAGGRAYGYRPVPGKAGQPEIVPEEAPIVVRSFEAYAKGMAPKAICRMLNAEGVPAPRGKLWAPSALLGMAGRGTGILRNPLYVGRLVWNKNRMVKDPSTGKRVSRPNPERDWQTADVPELRIVSQELFEAVQAQLVGRSNAAATGPMVANARPQYLLSGLVKCGACGAGMARAGKDKSDRHRLRCSAHTNSGACPEPKTFYADDVYELVLASLANELASPDQINRYAETYIKARIAGEANEDRRRGEIERRIAAIAKDNERLVDMMLKEVGDADALGAKMKDQGRERDRLKVELATLPEGNTVVLHPTAIKHLADKLNGPGKDWLHSPRALRELVIDELNTMGELAPIVRELITSITLYRDDDGRLVIRGEGTLGPFLREEGGRSRGGGHVGSGGGI